MEISAAALGTITDWAVTGDDFLAVQLHSGPPGYERGWARGDVPATQEDAHIHVDAGGAIEEVVPLAVVVADHAQR